MADTIHIGCKIAKLRKLKGMKQEVLALKLGVSQPTALNIENSQKIEDEVLEKTAKALGVPAVGIKNFSEEAIFNIIGNTANNHDQAAIFNYYPTFNPLEKWIEVIE